VLAAVAPSVRQCPVPTLVLYRFRYFDPLRQRWIGARHALQAPEIRCRYSDYELIGAPEIRHVPDHSAHFNPFAESAPTRRII